MSAFIKYVGIIGGIILLALLFFQSGKLNKRLPPREPEVLQEISSPATTTSAAPLFDKKPAPASAKKIIPPLPKIIQEIEIPKSIVSSSSPGSLTEKATSTAAKPVLPPLDEAALFRAVVKIQCPASNGLDKYIGSGFALKGGIVVTAAHVVKDSGSEVCDIIFSRERHPIYYLHGKIDNLKEVRRRHDEEGIDVAILKLPLLDIYQEARAIFEEYPYIPYPVCSDPKMLGDALFHFGYPSNFLDQSYLSRQEGEAVVAADIKSIIEQLSEDGTFTFKTPVLSLTYEESSMHPYMVSRVATFYGDSGGLAFDATKQCIAGIHRGGTIGKGPGENFSIFMNLGWPSARALLPSS